MDANIAYLIGFVIGAVVVIAAIELAPDPKSNRRRRF